MHVGCGSGSRPMAERPGSWRVVAVDPPLGEVRRAEPGGAIPSVLVSLDGPSGFLRATIVVERTTPGSVPRTALYDVLFPVPGRVRFEASVRPARDQPDRVQVQFRVESALDTSVGIVEPGVPFLSPDASIILEGVGTANGLILEGEETAVGRWVVQVGQEVSKVTIRVLLSKAPTEPRLKLNSRPPVGGRLNLPE